MATDDVLIKKLNLVDESTKTNLSKLENNKLKSTSQSLDLPKVLYLKKGLQLKPSGTMSSNKEPIPKLIVSTKSIKLANQYDQLVAPADGVRYITTARKPAITDNNDSSSNKVDAIKSTKIIIKGITSQDKRLMVCESPIMDPLASSSQEKRLLVCESPIMDPLASAQLSRKLNSPTVFPVIESNKAELHDTIIDPGTTNMDIPTKPLENHETTSDQNQDNRLGTNLSTLRANREMKQLQKTMKESKILTDFINAGDMRRIKRKMDDSEVNDVHLEPSQTTLVRSRSLSESKDNEYIISVRRNTRSLNAEFSAKQRKFLAGIQKHSRDSDDDRSDEDRVRGGRKINRKSGKSFPPLKPGYDKYCWQCHQNDPQIPCTKCKRTYHMECLKPKQIPKSDIQKSTWECPECALLEIAIQEVDKTKYDFNQLCTMLQFALKRIKLTSKTLVIPSESENIVNPVSFTSMEQKISNKEFISTQSFLTDARWILHNCTIFYSRNAKLLATAKTVFKICKQEIYDIDTCHECYYKANTCKTDWFVEVCSRPHILVWAKLKGFPYWPAKAMTTNSQGMVDVRFFGDHDRAFVPIRECFLYSEEHPNPITVKSKRQSIAHSVLEVDQYIKRLTSKFGSFHFPESKTLFDPFNENEQLEKMIPNYRNYTNNLVNKKSTSKSDLTYKIVKTADNNLSIVKKNDKMNPSVDTIVDDRTPSVQVERKHAKNASIERLNDTIDDLKYQVMKTKRDSATSRVDGRVDSVILKRKAESPLTIDDNRKKIKLVTNDRRMSQPIVTKEISKPIASKNPVEKISLKRRTSISKNNIDDDITKMQLGKRVDRKLSIKCREMPSKDEGVKSNLKEDLISSVVKKLDTLQAFVSTNDNSKLRSLDSVNHSNKTPEKEITTEKNSNLPPTEIVDNQKTVIPRQLEQSVPDRNVETNVPASKTDEDENLLVPMDRPIHELRESKTEIQMATVTSSRQGSMSGSSIQSISGSVDDAMDICIKSEPLSDDEKDNPEEIREEIMTPLDNQKSQNGVTESNIAKITVKNINTMTKPLPQLPKPQIIRKIVPCKSVVRTDPIKQNARKSFINNLKTISKQKATISPNTTNVQQAQQQQNAQLKQSQNMVCIPMDRSNFQRIESIMLGNQVRGPANKSNPPPLTVVSAMPPTIGIIKDATVSKPKNIVAQSASTVISSVGPPPLSLSSQLILPEQSTIVHPTMASSKINDSIASTFTDIMKHNDPKSAPKLIGPLRFDGTNQLTSEAGHYSKMLIDNSHKFADFFRSVFEVTLSDIASMGCFEARIQLLEMELEQCKLTHAKELADMKAGTSLLLTEMKKNFETDKTKLINETRRQCELDRIRAVEDTKKRQWCINCGKEAKFYCCWNTSYCDYPCQQQHWPRHMSNCSQNDEFNGVHASTYPVKGKEMPQSQNMAATLRQFTTANTKNTLPSNVRPNQVFQRVVSISQAARNNLPIQKNAQGQIKIINRSITGIMPASSSVSNAKHNLSGGSSHPNLSADKM